MSKAFTKEDDSRELDEDLEKEGPQLPVGVRNYMTPQGAEKMRAELKDLLNRVRPELTQVVQWAAANGDRSENADYIYGKRRLREIDRRIRFLSKRLENAEIIDPTTVQADSVRFGATVRVRLEDGSEKTYSIVGIDEIDAKTGKISWLSPLGSTLLKAKEGDSLTFRSPKGEQEIEIISIQYIEIK